MSAGPADAAAPPLVLRTYVEGDATVVQCVGKLSPASPAFFATK